MTLKRKDFQLRVYSDASFSCNDDLSYQIGCLILLCNIENIAYVLDCSSRKSKIVVRFIMEDTFCACLHAFDAALVIHKDLEKILGREVSLLMFTDSEQLFYAITREKETTEKKLMIDITIVWKAYNRFYFTAVGLIGGDKNSSDNLTKESCNNA